MAIINGNSGNDILPGTDDADVITGRAGADTLTGGGGVDTFGFAAGHSVLTIGGTQAAGTISGYDTITDYAQGEIIAFTGATVVSDGVANRVARSTLRLAGGEIRSHSITNGIISFDTSNNFAGAQPITTMSDVAAAVQYLQLVDFGNAGATLAFTATIGGVTHTFVFIQGNNGGTNTQDVLIDLVGVAATDVNAAGGQISLTTPVVVPPPPVSVDPGPTEIGGWGNDNTFEITTPTDGSPNLVSGEAPALAGVQSGFPALAWHTSEGIQVQFMDLLGNNDPDPIFGRVTASDGQGNERGVQIADALVAYGVGWMETIDGKSVVKLRAVVQEAAPIGPEHIVGSEAGDGFDHAAFNNHSFSLGAYDFFNNVDIPDPADPTATIPASASGLNVTWVATDPAATDPDYGRIMLQRYHLTIDATGHVSGMAAAGLDGQNEAHANRDPLDGIVGNDLAVEIAANGRDPSVTGLHTGETLVAWIELRNGVEVVNARLYPPNGAFVPSDTILNAVTAQDYTNANNALAAMSLSTAAQVAAGQSVKVQEYGPGNFVVTWVSLGASGLELRGQIYMLPPDNAFGDGLPLGWSVFDIDPTPFNAGFNGDYQLTGLGEDDGDVVVTYSANDGSGSGVYAFVIEGDGNRSTEPGGAQVGDTSPHVLVNTSTVGDQRAVAVTGLISERFMVSYVDADGFIKTRMMDTREPGQFLLGDPIVDVNADGVVNSGDRIRSRPDIMVGTTADDVIIGDRVDPQITGVDFREGGNDDELYGGLGADILFGGGGFDIIDGGNDLRTPSNANDPVLGTSPADYADRAIFLGESVFYNIWINGDGSYSVLDARFDNGAALDDQLADGTLNIDGWDIVHNVELMQFLEGDIDYIRDATYAQNLAAAKNLLANIPGTHTAFDTSEFYHLRTQDERLTGNVDAGGMADANPIGIEYVETPVGWGNTRAEADYGIKITDQVDGLGAELAETRPVIGATAELFVVGWVNENAGGTTSTFKFTNYDALAKAMPVDGGGNVVTVSANAVSGGPLAVSGLGANTFAVWMEQNTATNAFELRGQMYDLGGVTVGTNLVIASALSSGAIADVSISEQMTDLPPFPDPSQPDGLLELDTLITATWVANPDAGGYGAITAQRYAVALDNTTGLDQPPIPVGRDGDSRDGQNGAFTLGNGRAPSSTGLHDGEVAFTWVTDLGGGNEGIAGTVIAPLNDGTSSVFDFSVNSLTGFQSVADGYAPKVIGAGPGDINVGWLGQDASGNYVAQLAVYKYTGGHVWLTPATALTLQNFGATRPADFSVSVVGEDAPEYIVSWRDANDEIVAQRYDYFGEPVGDPVAVTAGRIAGDGGSQSASDATAAMGLLDGRFVIAYTETDANDGDIDIEARVFDTRSAEVAEIGRDRGGPRDFMVGTAFDDIMDGRDRADTLHGALGDDILIGGINDDIVDGGAGNDDLFGGTGTDGLTGGDGDDLLVGGYGRDYIAGGEGEDTLSYQGEARGVNVDLVTGLVFSDENVNAVVLPDAATTFLDMPAIALINRAVEDVLGEVIEVNHDLEIFQFVYDQDIENVIGSAGNDIIRGQAGANKLSGGRGDDLLEGRGGNDILDGGIGTDTARFSGNRSEYLITEGANGALIIQHIGGIDGTDTVSNVELFDFNGTIIPVAGILSGNPESFLQFAPSLSLAENSSIAEGNVIGVLSAIDVNGVGVSGFTFAFGTGGNPGGLFEIAQAVGSDTAEVRALSSFTLDFETQQALNFAFTGTNGTATISASPTMAITDVNEAFGDVIIPDGGVIVPMLENSIDAVISDIRVTGDQDGFTTGFRTYHFEVTGDIGTGIGAVEMNRFIPVPPAEDMPADAVDPAGSQYGLEMDTELHGTLDFEAEVASGRFALAAPVAGVASATNTVTLRTWEDLNGDGDFDLGVDKEDFFDIEAILQDTNEAQTGITVTSLTGTAINVDENTAGTPGANLATLAVLDPDIHSSAFVNHVLTVSDARFVIASDPVDGWVLRLADGASLDHEAEPIVNVTVTATDPTLLDAGGQPVAVSTSVQIQVNDLADEVVITSFSGGPVDEGTAGAGGVVVGMLVVGNATGTVSFTVSDPRFGVDPDGTVRLLAGQALDFVPGAPPLSITVTATDALGVTSSPFTFDVVINDVVHTATGAVIISDTSPTEGLLLTADTSAIADLDGLGAFTYQWQALVGTTWTDVGTNSATFTPTQAEVGRQVRAVVSFTDQDGGSEVITSAATEVVGDLINGTGAANTLNGTAGADAINGNGGGDTINGLAGDDVLNGGTGNDTINGGTGNDTMSGNAGNDTFIVDSAGDVVIEAAGQGTDTVQTSLASYTLGANVENLTITAGSTGDRTFTGNGLNNSITGGDGNDTINGGAGADIMVGGAGADTINTGGLDNTVDLIRFSAITDFGDTVFNFNTTGTDDRIELGGALNTALDDGNNNNNILFATGNGGAGTVNATVGQANANVEGLLLTGANGEGVTTATLGNASAVASAFNAEFNITAANGEDALLVINDTNGNSFTMWYWVQQAGGTTEVDASELTLIATVNANGTATSDNFDFF